VSSRSTAVRLGLCCVAQQHTQVLILGHSRSSTGRHVAPAGLQLRGWSSSTRDQGATRGFPGSSQEDVESREHARTLSLVLHTVATPESYITDLLVSLHVRYSTVGSYSSSVSLAEASLGCVQCPSSRFASANRLHSFSITASSYS
jgi:hypothetical protein